MYAAKWALWVTEEHDIVLESWDEETVETFSNLGSWVSMLLYQGLQRSNDCVKSRRRGRGQPKVDGDL